jgi:hypothetical protein
MMLSKRRTVLSLALCLPLAAFAAPSTKPYFPPAGNWAHRAR